MKSKADQIREGLLWSTALCVLGFVHRYYVGSIDIDYGENPSVLDDPNRRILYESDDDKMCLEDEACRFVLGLALLAVTPILICWNEHQYVRIEDLYNTARRFVRDLKKPEEYPTAKTDGKFVCFSGRLEGETTLVDNLFPSVQVKNSLLLVREIEIYQCVQVKNGDDRYELKEQWCKKPQPDPSRFPHKKNTNGNWDMFANESRTIATGHKLHGEPIHFGDNVVVFRAPYPSIGAFVLPPALMDEAFLGERHVHRLGELELVRMSQGKWTHIHVIDLPDLPVRCLGLNQKEGNPFIYDGTFIYDGEKDRIGSIRFQWRMVEPQNMTVAAEAVAPGRACAGGYGSIGRYIDEPGAKLEMVKEDLCFRFEEQGLLTKQGLFESCEKWTVTPFTVLKKGWLVPYEKRLGRLWMYAPGRLTAKELFARAARANYLFLWKVRAMAYVLLFFGWCLVFEPLTNLFRATFLYSLLSLTFAGVAFVLSTTCWMGCTAASRLSARPVQSILIIATVWIVFVQILNKLDKDEDNSQF